jgi:hypothetical protein
VSKRTPPKVTTAATVGLDVDLGTEDVRLKDGSRLTEQRAAEIVEEGATRRWSPVTVRRGIGLTTHRLSRHARRP